MEERFKRKVKIHKNCLRNSGWSPFCCIPHEVCVSSTRPYPHVPLQSFRSQMGLRGFSPRAKQLSFSVSPAGRGCGVNTPSGNVWAYIEKLPPSDLLTSRRLMQLWTHVGRRWKWARPPSDLCVSTSGWCTAEYWERAKNQRLMNRDKQQEKRWFELKANTQLSMTRLPSL